MHRNQPEPGITTSSFSAIRTRSFRPGLPVSRMFAIAALLAAVCVSANAQTPQLSTRAEVEQCMSHLQGELTEEARKAALTDCVFAFDSQLGAADTWKANADPAVAVSYARGPEEVRAFWAKQYSVPNFKLDWWPTRAEQHGSYVVTSGESRMTFTDKSGKTITQNGHYVTVWHRQADGTYRFAWDGGE